MTAARHYLTTTSGDIEAFKQSVSRNTNLSDYPLATSVEQNALVYSGHTVLEACRTPADKQRLMDEWITVWSEGPGILMISQAMDTQVIDQANKLFESTIEDQKKNNLGGGDHFAKAGTNDRIWNALEKHSKGDTENFLDYYANETIALASEAWLGTGYQITAQVNCVNPGAAAQSAHRDYHLGFMSQEQAAKYPLHVHRLSPVLTLQGAIAHCDMPLESGPTLYLPYSQNYPEGYLAFNRSEFQNYFEKNRSQPVLKKGDMVFFNPALMHAAGANSSSNISRLANLLQVSSAFGRGIESVDYQQIIESVYPALLKHKQSNSFSMTQLENIVCACTDGYPFPTNLDTDLPTDGLAPKSQRQMTTEALVSGESSQVLKDMLRNHQNRRRSNVH